jgi:hypothetical protein
MTTHPAAPVPVAFVACIEAGPLARQTLRLFDSLRRFGGRFSGCPAYAVSPRPSHAIDRETRAALRALDVVHIEEHLNRDCPQYGSANRVAAAAHVEAHASHEILVVLDSDTLFLREPIELLLAHDVDAAVRPVDIKGMCSSGPDDPCDDYWQRLCRLADVDYAAIPWTHASVDGARIKASYNGGLVVARTRGRILQRWAEIFFASARDGLVPRSRSNRFRAGAGWVEPSVGRWWGTNQAALSLALWGSTRAVQELPPGYNYPLHLHARMPRDRNADPATWVHVHYHWLFDADRLGDNPLLNAFPSDPELQHWLHAQCDAGSTRHPGSDAIVALA